MTITACAPVAEYDQVQELANTLDEQVGLIVYLAEQYERGARHAHRR